MQIQFMHHLLTRGLIDRATVTSPIKAPGHFDYKSVKLKTLTYRSDNKRIDRAPDTSPIKTRIDDLNTSFEEIVGLSTPSPPIANMKKPSSIYAPIPKSANQAAGQQESFSFTNLIEKKKNSSELMRL